MIALIFKNCGGWLSDRIRQDLDDNCFNIKIQEKHAKWNRHKPKTITKTHIFFAYKMTNFVFILCPFQQKFNMSYDYDPRVSQVLKERRIANQLQFTLINIPPMFDVIFLLIHLIASICTRRAFRCICFSLKKICNH